MANTKRAYPFVNSSSPLTKFFIMGDTKHIHWRDSGKFYRCEDTWPDEEVMYKEIISLRKKLTRRTDGKH